MTFKIEDVVEVQKGCPWVHIVGRVGFVHQILPNNNCIVTLEKPVMIQEPGGADMHITTSFYLQSNHLVLLEEAEDTYVQDLEDQLHKVQDDLQFTRACLALSEELREELFNKVNLLQRDVKHADKKE